ncbi:MAG: DeoR family transcriptional regulator [Oscillospiraceae bacterium]|nr:DeoR family transcriptional regulator [Oscillospiraceae bacterium]
MSAINRRVEIVRILRGTAKTTMPSLADTLGVSINTIKRDILALTVDDGFLKHHSGSRRRCHTVRKRPLAQAHPQS